MILKNKKNIYAAKARVGLLPAYAAQLIVSNLGNSGSLWQDKIFTPKGLNFSSLYQNANFSSNASNSTVAKAISNKAITSVRYSQFFLKKTASSRRLIINQPIKKKFHFFLSPILTLANKELLAYNFLANTNISSLKKKM